MTSTIVQHKVKDFAMWKKGFDSAAEMRTSSGELTAQIFRDVSDPNMVTVLNKWSSLESAQKFIQSPELKAEMEKLGIEGAPKISFLNEA